MSESKYNVLGRRWRYRGDQEQVSPSATAVPRTKSPEHGIRHRRRYREPTHKEIGYQGWITLVSPQGEQDRVYLRGRHKYTYGTDGCELENGRTTVMTVRLPFLRGPEREAVLRHERKFSRLLSQGWRVVTPPDDHSHEEEQAVREDEPSVTPPHSAPQDEPEGKEGEKDKKDTDVVIGSTKSGDQSHGGDHASCEVKDSPNYAQRGCRGGRGQEKTEEKKRQKRTKPEKSFTLKKSAQRGAGSVFCPQPFKVSDALIESAKTSAALLAELIGRAVHKKFEGVKVNAQDLLVALETGDNPIPPLEARRERPRARILVTPDCSGSCQSFSGLGRAWARAISNIPDTDVIFLENSNGELMTGNTSGRDPFKVVAQVDVIVYLGDMDGFRLCTQYADMGATVLAMDCTCAQAARPRLRAKPEGVKGDFFWVWSVSRHAPETWYQALCLALGRSAK